MSVCFFCSTDLKVSDRSWKELKGFCSVSSFIFFSPALSRTVVLNFVGGDRICEKMVLGSIGLILSALYDGDCGYRGCYCRVEEEGKGCATAPKLLAFAEPGICPKVWGNYGGCTSVCVPGDKRDNKKKVKFRLLTVCDYVDSM